MRNLIMTMNSIRERVIAIMRSLLEVFMGFLYIELAEFKGLKHKTAMYLGLLHKKNNTRRWVTWTFKF